MQTDNIEELLPTKLQTIMAMQVTLLPKKLHLQTRTTILTAGTTAGTATLLQVTTEAQAPRAGIHTVAEAATTATETQEVQAMAAVLLTEGDKNYREEKMFN